MLSFSELAQQISTFPQANEKRSWKGFLGSSEQLFKSKKEDLDPEEEVKSYDFRPIVSLTPISDQKTGEENETVVYSHRAKLFRYDKKEWKERGVGDIKILRHNETKKCRIVMRREQIHKLCANHFITCDMELKRNAGSDRSWMWSVDADFSDGVTKNELFAVKFKHPEDATIFQEKFIECQQTERNDEISLSRKDTKENIVDDDLKNLKDETIDAEEEVEIIFERCPSVEEQEKAKSYQFPKMFYCFDEKNEKDDEDQFETQLVDR